MIFRNLSKVLGFALLISPAHAYVTPSYFNIRSIAKKHSSFETGTFRHKLTLYSKSGEVQRTLNETLSFTSSDMAGVKLTTESGAELAVQKRKLTDGGSSALSRPVLYDLLFVKDATSIFDHFKALGLPLHSESELYSERDSTLPYKAESTVSLQRLDGRVAIAMKSDSAAQLWLEKDSYLPLKALFPSPPQPSRASEPLEYRFSNYQVFGSLLYPRLIQIYKRGSLWLKIETTEGTLGSAIAFDSNAPRVSPDSDTQEFLEQYLKWIR